MAANNNIIICAAQLLITISAWYTTDCPVNELRDPVDNGNSSICTLSTSSVKSSLTIDQGIVNYDSAGGIGSIAWYECNDGLRLDRTCLYNGSWSGSIPQCSGKIIRLVYICM